MDALKLIAQDSMKQEVPQIEIGDTIKVDVNIREGDRERIQVFEGTVIARKGSGISETFTVRRGCSLSIPPTSRESNWCARAMSAGQSSIICVTEWARLQNSGKKSDKRTIKGTWMCPFFAMEIRISLNRRERRLFFA